MAINKKLIHFKSKQKFNEELANGNILETSIVFILDTKEIYTHGQFYDGSTFDPSNIEKSIENIINDKQDKLVSGTNIKTINGDSILGEGNITIEGGSSDTYYLELPLGEDGQCLSTGTLTQEQFEEMASCKTLIVRTSNMSSDGISASEDIAFDWRVVLIEQSDESEMKGIICSNIYPNPFNNCLTSYIFIFSSNGSECIYELIAKLIFLDSDIFDPTAVHLSDKSIYELNIPDNTESGEISEEEFNLIISSKTLILNVGMHKIVCIQRTAPEVHPDTYYFYGNFFEGVELKIFLSLLRRDGVCIYTIQTKSVSSSETTSAYLKVYHGTSDLTYTLTPNTFHVWDNVNALTLTLGDEIAGVSNEYIFQFISGSEPTTLILPDNVKFNLDFTIEENKIYQISILNRLGTVMSWDI